MTGAVIVGAEIAAGHDGIADLVLSLHHENGVIAPVVVDGQIAFDLMKRCGAASLADLIGQPWRDFLGENSRTGLACTTF